MADDFKNDPEYNKARDEVERTRQRSASWTAGSALSTVGGWGLAALALAAGGMLELGAIGIEVGTLGLGTPIAIGLGVAGAALIGGGIYASYKAREARKDYQVSQAQATASLTGHYVERALERQRQFESGPETSSTRFQDMENARRAVAQGAAR